MFGKTGKKSGIKNDWYHHFGSVCILVEYLCQKAHEELISRLIFKLIVLTYELLLILLFDWLVRRVTV